MKYNFRIAEKNEISIIWKILQNAILRRKNEGSNQWQDGYPNIEILKKDIKNKFGHVLTVRDTIIGYCAISINNEPEYDKIEGKWLTNKNEAYVVYHRVAIDETFLGKGYAEMCLNCIEKFAQDQKIYSIKADTNHDNNAMLHIFNKLNYKYCGIVHFRGSPRRAYEKILSPKNS